METWDRGCEEPEDRKSCGPAKNKGAEGHSLTDHVQMFGFHSSTIECVCGGEHVGRVIRAYIPSKRLFLDPLGNLNTERLTLYSAWNLNMSWAPMFITLFFSSCLSVNVYAVFLLPSRPNRVDR